MTGVTEQFWTDLTFVDELLDQCEQEASLFANHFDIRVHHPVGKLKLSVIKFFFGFQFGIFFYNFFQFNSQAHKT